MRTASLGLVLGYLLAFLAIGRPAAAQSTTGSIQGIVRDNQGGVIPGATVTLRNVETNATRSLATAADGSYRFLNMPIGNYELTAELSGFSRHLRSGLTLAVNQDAVVDVELRPAALTEAIEVRADAPIINTTNATTPASTRGGPAEGMQGANA